MTKELEASIRPRPIRIAFLVSDGEHSDLALDAIFADSYGRWGGRFSLIVPCVDSRISPAYWPWLEIYDPDIVYSYVSLSRDDVLEVHERLCPSEYKEKEIRDAHQLDARSFKPDYRFTPLSSLSTVFRQARYTRSDSGSAPVKLLDAWHSERPSRFFTDNFGTYHGSYGTSLFPLDTRTAAGLKTVIRPEISADRRYGVPQDLDTLPNELEAFRAFAEREVMSLSMASLLFAPKLDFRIQRWSEAFSLVIGNTFADRVLHWNARMLIPAWLDTELCCLRVGPEQFDDPDFVTALGEFLKRRNHVNDGGGGQTSVVIRSASLPIDQLEAIRAKLVATRPWGPLRTEVVESLDEVVPPATDIQSAREMTRYLDGMAKLAEWTRFVWAPPNLRPPLMTPSHLDDLPPGQHFGRGYWAADLSIELDETGPRFGDQNRWLLPKRWRMAGAFTITRAGGNEAELPPRTRRSRNGTLAVFMRKSAPVESISVPTTSHAIYYALVHDGAWVREGEGAVLPVSKAKLVDPSNEARYLTGVVGLAGGLRQAAAYLLHPFLMDMFGQLGGKPTLPADKLQPAINWFTKRQHDPRQAVFDISEDDDRTKLATQVVKVARSLKTPREATSFRELQKRWEQYRARYWEANPQGPRDPDDQAAWEVVERNTLDETLIGLRQRQMLFQGHRWVCGECHHRNWVDLASLASDLTCMVCKTATQAPVAIDWLFRPNEFLIECLRDRSALSLVWVLETLSQRALGSFYFTGPTLFFYSHEAYDGRQPDAEADLLAVVDGRAILCEVKSSWSIVSSWDIQKLVTLAKRLRPDVALFAVMEDDNKFAIELETAKTELEAEGIAFETMIWRTATNGDDPMLPGRL